MFSRSSLARTVLSTARRPLQPVTVLSRARNNLAPRQVKHIKRHKGRVPIPIGGSTKGTTLAYGDWGVRIKGNGARLTAKQLETAEESIADYTPGKGTFEFWATRVSIGRVILEIGGTPIREELAREALRLASSKLPTKMEFISRTTPPRLGNLILHPPKAPRPITLDQPPPPTVETTAAQPNV
ncbi:mitochondrial 54S ribosomal protein YmL47 [Mycena leptocephala]|nr:mitochondrial 54S ribosomal protein YmL47 [Mycena leptocephala]